MAMNGASFPVDMGLLNLLMMTEEDLREQLIPGLPDPLVLEIICPKLSWRDFHFLSLVSPRWLEAIRAHRVYDARVRCNSTETLVATINCHLSGDCPSHNFHTIVLYSKRDEVEYRLPPIPDHPTGIPRSCQCVSLDGKLYCLGGAKEIVHYTGSMEVYVLDLAGQREWKQCASMREGRLDFGVGVIDGRIYVFGGSCGFESVSGSEVYDPVVNEWSDIKPMPSFRHQHYVVAMGEELFVHGGELLHTYILDRAENRLIDLDENLEDEDDYNEDNDEDHDSDDEDHDDEGDEDEHQHGDEDEDEPEDEDEEQQWLEGLARDPTFTEVYHPVKDEWRLIEKFGKDLHDGLFVAQGRLHVMSLKRNKVGIYVHKPETESWALLRESLLAELGASKLYKYTPLCYCGCRW